MNGKAASTLTFVGLLMYLSGMLQAQDPKPQDKKEALNLDSERVITLPPIVIPSIESGTQNEKDPIFSYSLICQIKILNPKDSLKIRDHIPFFMDKVFSYFYGAMPVLAYADYVPSEVYIQDKLNEILKQAYGTEQPLFDIKLISFIRLLPNYMSKVERRKLRHEDKEKGWQTSVGQTSKTKPSKAGSI